MPQLQRPPRPARHRILDELGAPRTLLDTPDQYEFLAGPGPLLLLSLGPNPQAALEALPAALRNMPAAVVESADFLRQMPAGWREAWPAHWTPVEPASIPAGASILRYRPAARLFPSFWEPILARLTLERLSQNLPPGPPATTVPTIALPGSEQELLHRELADAIARLGFALAPPADSVQLLLRQTRPSLFLSVNARGLDPWGEAFHLLRAAGVPVAIWCVDTPWHILSRCKGPWWKAAHLFVTDHTFVEDLQRQGATHVVHLPLAGWPEGFAPQGAPDPALAEHGLFVGRTAFPGRDAFFASQRLPPGLLEAAQAMLEAGDRPDLWWWINQLHITDRWPGPAIRQAGLGAAESSLLWRQRCLQAALQAGSLTVMGDDAWATVLAGHPTLRLHPPVDYYGPLARLYRDAAWVLNSTNLLLPAGCTQRHFDVWLAGGLLVTDAHAGLSLFPEDLVRPIRFSKAADIPALVNLLSAQPRETAALRRAWREEITSRHRYTHRLATILDTCTSNPPRPRQSACHSSPQGI
ncbi:glycosyltransferase family protein [Megalodesulfovibrio paquesii]